VRFLFVLPDLPATPFTGAHTRPLTMLRAAARAHEVVAAGAAPAGADLEALRELCIDVLSVSDAQARPAGRRMLAAGRRMLSPVPLVGRGRSEAVAALVERAVGRHQPQALFVETMYAVHYRVPELPTMVDLPDVVSGLCEAAAAAHPLRYAAARRQAAVARRQEVELLRGVLPVTINDDDRERLSRLGVTAFTVPLAVTPPSDEQVAGRAKPAGGSMGQTASTSPFTQTAPAAGPLRLLFVGSYLHAPNREAARFLVRRLAPALRAACLPFHLTLAGRAAPDWLLRSAGTDISVLSDVADLAPLYQSADVVVAPLAHGGGTKNKTLEAMAWGLPVVGTPQAFTGLAVPAGVGYLRAPLRAAEMARALGALAADPARRAHLGQTARRYVLAAHSRELAEARAAAVFDAVAGGGGVAEAEALWRSRAAGESVVGATAQRTEADDRTHPQTAAAADGAGNPAAVS
jgi:glycosyltransferase involved in cell wall biosynthesis